MRATAAPPLPPGYAACAAGGGHPVPIAGGRVLCEQHYQRLVGLARLGAHAEQERGPAAVPPAPEVYLSVPEAANLCCVAPATVRGWIAAGVLPARPRGLARGPHGVRYEIARSALVRFMAEHGRQAAAGE